MGDASGAPDRWLVLSLEIPRSPLAALLAQGLIELGGRSVEEIDGAYVSFFPPPRDRDAFLADAGRTLEALSGLPDVRLDWRWQPHEDWTVLWKRGLAPRRITERLLVTPSWCEPEAGAEDCVIVIDPGTAFGTAEHGTTRACLRLLDPAVSPGSRILDAGCGSGILAIAAAKLGAANVLAVDSDPQAYGPARDNVESNAVADAVSVRQAVVTAELLARIGPFDGIVANIRSGVLVPLLEGFRLSLRDGGWLISSGILDEEWADFARAAAAAGFRLVAEDVDGEWRSGRFEAG